MRDIFKADILNATLSKQMPWKYPQPLLSKAQNREQDGEGTVSAEMKAKERHIVSEVTSGEKQTWTNTKRR